ncbi:MAG TPA: dodecin family protein [Atribacterota bacterium]|nr:dodecin family protein [Atribacterota bacterium]HOR41635.1 dodecin family protein [Atribacterota bacterium]
MESVYKIIEIVGTSEKSWEDAAKKALDTVSKTIQDIRIAEVNKLDIKMTDDGNMIFRAKLNISFKYRETD